MLLFKSGPLCPAAGLGLFGLRLSGCGFCLCSSPGCSSFSLGAFPLLLQLLFRFGPGLKLRIPPGSFFAGFELFSKGCFQKVGLCNGKTEILVCSDTVTLFTVCLTLSMGMQKVVVLGGEHFRNR